MKKILLGTTALIGAAGLFAGAALAEAPKVTLGGVSDFQAGMVSEDLDAGLRSYGLRNDNEINVNVDGVSDSGLEYGAQISLEADVTNDVDNEGSNAARTFLYLQGKNWGRVELGSNAGVASTLKVDASNIAAATGGIDGDFNYFTSSAAQFLATPDLTLAYGVGNLGDESVENASKITYYTPNFNGFQAGISYVVDSGERGQNGSGFRSDTNGNFEDVFDIAAKYSGDLGGFAVAAAATYETGDAEVGGADVDSWNLGGSVGYMGFTAAASYGNLDETFGVSNDADYWTLGLAYAGGNYNASVTYLNSTIETGAGDNDFDNLSVGVDFALAPGLTPYAEVSFIDQDAPGAAFDNDATVGIVGVELAF